MKTAYKRHLLDLAGIVLILVIYYVLSVYCSRNDVASKLLARGSGADISHMAAALLFVAFRVFVITLLPACVLLRIATATLFSMK